MPARAMSDKLQQYHRDIPIILRCRTPTNSVTSTNIATLAPPEEKKKMLKTTIEYRMPLSFCHYFFSLADSFISLGGVFFLLQDNEASLYQAL